MADIKNLPAIIPKLRIECELSFGYVIPFAHRDPIVTRGPVEHLIADYYRLSDGSLVPVGTQ